MEFTQEASLAVNEYVDRVRMTLPLSPSARLASADRLYHEISSRCADRAESAGQIVIGLDTARAVLTEMGTTDECARKLAEEHSSGAWQWPGDYFVGAFKHHRIGERAERAAKVAMETGVRVGHVSMDAAASALDVAARKLREAAEKLKQRD